ncbi:MAG: aminotransferase class III-fold pyridoxal phosphate-dependent enzyme [Candidatus Aminicenantes bacterium]|nr:aminotransferase class III-fold pyridoxal phosphate-dependent enzyme [Candidatus Aminicenantes bacterium]
MTSVDRAPRFGLADAAGLAESLFGLRARAEILPGERDQNFLLTRLDAAPGSGRFVLKIANPDEERAVLEMQNAALRRLAVADPGLVPEVLPNLEGSLISEFSPAGGERHFVRLVSYIEGEPLAAVKPHSPELLRDVGRAVGRIARGLSGFEHPMAGRPFVWNLDGGIAVVRRHGGLVREPSRWALLERFLAWLERDAEPHWGRLSRSVVHNDANDYNVIVAPAASGDASFGRRVAAVVDFGDMVRSFTLSDAAVACAYTMLGKADPLAAAAQVLAGFQAELPMPEGEIDLLYPLIVLRLLLSVANCARQSLLRPGNEYLKISNAAAWALLERLDSIHPRFAAAVLRRAAGFAPCPNHAAAVQALRSMAGRFAPVLGEIPPASKRTVFDLSIGTLLIADPAEAVDSARLTEILFGEMKTRGAALGLGRYNEPRIIYAGPAFRPTGDPLAEGRTVHLGIDLFVEAGEPVCAPLDGVVHSIADNARPYDYGPTVILEHRLEEGGPAFYTLYGHLARASTAGLAKGRPVRRGEPFAAIGPDPENGGWPPHLHFQIILDLLDREGDFPGVARASEREIWTSLCPDPNLILGLPADELADPALLPAEIIKSRREHLGPSLSLSYCHPIKIVRGFLQHLYDDTGRIYLDAVNNVPHVGHCHPRVVEAVRRQAAVLATNTRYLHDHLARYIDRLTAKLPPSLAVVYLVNSGSEANDLALRLARRFTGRESMVVVDGAYHGHLTSLIAISPYKFNGKGGRGCPPGTYVVPMPDLYQGPFRAGDPEAGSKYARAVSDALVHAAGEGRPAAGFIAESILSCGGQIVLPEGFLAESYRVVRAAGGVCIADEVQVGFGRAGSAFWAFETQAVVPDIVTMGKPIGNGFPLAAVVTTRAIADAFADGMEYFNTYGGNPVACAAGLAVLDVIEGEGLQRNALDTGAYLLSGLRRLAEAAPIIGDVRGLGLFLGFELVLDPSTRARAPLQAAYLAERMREEGVLVSTDGPFRNVIKIKPPLVFDRADADLFLAVLARILSEDPLRI